MGFASLRSQNSGDRKEQLVYWGWIAQQFLGTYFKPIKLAMGMETGLMPVLGMLI